jgi:two-component system sensor histidine kinase/response regulator
MPKILIIEDDTNVRENISELLEFNGFTTYSAENGLQGVLKAIKHKPDLIVCDVMMPEMDGFEVLNAVRENEAIAQTSFIFLTAKVEKANFRDAMKIGADDYLTKPFDLKELLDAINIRLEKQKKIKELISQKAVEARNFINQTSTHEFNTPLYGIIGSSKMLVDYFDEFTKYEQKELITAIYQSALRLQHTVEKDFLFNLIEQFKNEPGKKNSFIDGTTYQAKMAIAEAVNVIGEHFGRLKDIRFEAEDANLKVSKENFGRVIHELLYNAMKFSSSGSPVQLKGTQQNDGYFISISDKGRGMSTEELEQIGPFRQFSREKFEQQGRGLGLHLCREIIALHQGSFEIESSLGDGTNIRLSFPIAEKE